MQTKTENTYMKSSHAAPSQDRTVPCLFTGAQSSQYPPRAVSFSFSPLTCTRSCRHGRRPLPIGCVRLVANSQYVSGPRRPLRVPERVRTPCTSHCHVTPSHDHPDCPPLFALQVSSLMPSRHNIRLERSLALPLSHLHPLTDALSCRNGCRHHLVACVRLVAIPQFVSGPRRPLRKFSRAECAS